MRVLSTIFLISTLFLSMLNTQAQVSESARYRPATLINNALNSDQALKNVSLFNQNGQESTISEHPVLSQALNQGTLLDLKQKDIAEFRRFPAPFISMKIPTHEGNYYLRLVKVDVTSPGLVVRTSSMGNLDVDLGTHYRGVIENHTNSLVAISVFEDEVMGFFSSDEINGNYVIGKLKTEENAQHIAYRESDLKPTRDRSLDCFTEDDGEEYDPAMLLPRPPTEDAGDCVNVYVEVDFNYYQNYGSSTTTTTNNITGMFNQAITIYANENINMEVSDIFIWTSSSPYSGSASTMRTQFQNQTSSINGDLGHLVSYSTSGGSGIAAGFSGICASNVDNSLCVTQTNGSFATVPTYSRAVKVVTHEMGHLLGSRHTHACVWNGNNTSIDDYGNTNPPSGGSAVAGAEGGACFVSPGKISVTATIMSYYDSRGWGNFSMGNGFGNEPGNVIRNSVANGSCLSPCGGGGPVACSSTISSFPYSNDFESGLGWTQESSDDFDWTQRSGTTPSSGTGPSAASQGTFYAYMEVSSPNFPSKRAILNSPCFDLTGVTNPEITFDYHMLASPGTLDLEASTDGSTWTSVWTQTGDQGSAWNSATVSLNAYTNESEVRLRFNGISGTTWQGDICIDAIGIDGSGGGGGCNDTEVDLIIVLDNYPGETTWTLTDGSGATVASGGPYATANSTVNETFCLADDCYEFTINDSYGDGICCGYGNGSYTLTSGGSTLASGGNFGSSEASPIDIGNSCGGGGCPAIDFNSYTINSYGGSQDNGSSSIQDGGATLFLQNNAWKSISLNYTVTANTVVEFDFQSTLQGEIHGIGFDNDNGISSNLTFKVHGTQNWGITNYDNYSGSGWTTYTIPVGSVYTGSFDRLFFVADHDGSPSNGNAYFRNIKIYEGSCGSSDDLIEPVGSISIGNESELNFEVYPNPFDEEISINIPYVENQTAQVDIYNAAGQHVYSKSNVATGREVKIQPNVSAGVYIIQVQMGDLKHHIKLIKTK